MRLVVLRAVTGRMQNSLNLIMPGKRENRRPNPKPAPNFAIFLIVYYYIRMKTELNNSELLKNLVYFVHIELID